MLQNLTFLLHLKKSLKCDNIDTLYTCAWMTEEHTA